MSRQPGCFACILGPCRKRNKFAVSIENSNHTGTQTISYENPLRNSAPAALLPQQKKNIEVKTKKGFFLRVSENSERNLSLNRENSVIESIYPCGTENTDPLISSKSIENLFPQREKKNFSNPFMWNKIINRAILKPITPDQFSKRKLIPALLKPKHTEDFS